MVARAIAHELELVSAKDPVVYLDLTHLNAERVKRSASHDLRDLHAVQHRHRD